LDCTSHRADKDRIAAEKAVESARMALIEREKELAKVCRAVYRTTSGWQDVHGLLL
jgi:hypothetical protein